MILDSSCLVAILSYEPGHEAYSRAIGEAANRGERVRISAGNFIELSIVIDRRFPPGAVQQCDALFRRVGIVIEPVTVEQAHLARQAFHDFGKGRHPAALNFGDCFAYALAKSTGEQLLFKGDDFSKTDIASVL